MGGRASAVSYESGILAPCSSPQTQEKGCDHSGKDTQSGMIFKAFLVRLCSTSQDGLSPALNHADEIRLHSPSPEQPKRGNDRICSLRLRANWRENLQDCDP